MTNSEADNPGLEQLVQRFIDNELTSAERVQLLTRLGHDGPLREQLIELEQLAAGASQLPRPTVPADFVARVMEQTTPPPSFGRRLQDMLWTPHAFRWNLAGALGAACVTLFIAGAAATLGRSGPTIPTSTATTATASQRVLVRLVVLQPGAQTVGVAGDFNGWIRFRLRSSRRRVVPGPSLSRSSRDAMSTCSSSTARSGSSIPSPRSSTMTASDRAMPCSMSGRRRGLAVKRCMSIGGRLVSRWDASAAGDRGGSDSRGEHGSGVCGNAGAVGTNLDQGRGSIRGHSARRRRSGGGWHLQSVVDLIAPAVARSVIRKLDSACAVGAGRASLHVCRGRYRVAQSAGCRGLC